MVHLPTQPLWCFWHVASINNASPLEMTTVDRSYDHMEGFGAAEAAVRAMEHNVNDANGMCWQNEK